jgi:hypothetical protein
MDLSHARRVASPLGALTHRAFASLASQEQSNTQKASPQRRAPSRFPALAGFALVLFCGSANAQIAVVAVTECGPASFPGTPCTIPASGKGHLLVVGLQAGSGAITSTTISSITDNVGNSFVEAAGARSVDAAAGSLVDIWYARNAAAGSTTIMINPVASLQNTGVVIWELSGADPNAPLDQASALNSQPSSASPLGAPVVTQSANEVVLSLAAVAGNVTGIASGNSFIADSALKGNGWAHLITTSAGTYSAAWVQNPPGTYSASTVSFIAAASGSGVNPCDLNNDGVVNVLDENLAVSMSLGQAPCTANIDGADICNVVIVQRVVNAANGGVCITGNSHIVTLSWMPSISPNIAGYNIFRASVSGGPYTQINPAIVPTVSFSDNNVQAGQTYYYVTTAVDVGSIASVYSNEAPATVPSP